MTNKKEEKTEGKKKKKGLKLIVDHKAPGLICQIVCCS